MIFAAGVLHHDQYRRCQRIHRMHLVGYAVSATLVLIGMLLFWH